MTNLAKGTAFESLRYPKPVNKKQAPCARTAARSARSVAADKKRRECKRVQLANQLEKFYLQGVCAYQIGTELSGNPHGKASPMAMCAWAGGWTDCKNGTVRGLE